MRTILIDAPGRIGNSSIASNLQQLYEKAQAVASPIELILRAQLARSAATLMIQSVYRGWSTRRKYIAVAQAKLSIMTYGESDKSLNGLPSVDDLSIQERLWNKYVKYCGLLDKRLKLPPEFSQYCATLIQAQWKRFVVQRAWREIQAMQDEGHKTKQELETRIKLVRHGNRPRVGDTVFEQSAWRIQQAWRRHHNVRAYRFYRDLIRYSEQGNAHRLLKYINPKEAELIDASIGAHLRFRLGGENFPPKIYYKVYIHQNMVDMNAFSPRDYTKTKSKQVPPRHLFNKQYELPKHSEQGMVQA
eukprot:jgi/Hompol1/4218/HPOL_003588-RA